MLLFLVNVDLKADAKFRENPMKPLREQTIWNLTLVTSMFQSLVIILRLIYLRLFKHSKSSWWRV